VRKRESFLQAVNQPLLLRSCEKLRFDDGVNRCVGLSPQFGCTSANLQAHREGHHRVMGSWASLRSQGGERIAPTSLGAPGYRCRWA
jgi:hypothetical protein